MDDDVATVEIHQRIIRGLMRARDVTLGVEIEGDLVGQRALDVEGIPRQLPAIGRCKWPMNM